MRSPAVGKTGEHSRPPVLSQSKRPKIRRGFTEVALTNDRSGSNSEDASMSAARPLHAAQRTNVEAKSYHLRWANSSPPLGRLVRTEGDRSPNARTLILLTFLSGDARRCGGNVHRVCACGQQRRTVWRVTPHHAKQPPSRLADLDRQDRETVTVRWHSARDHNLKPQEIDHDTSPVGEHSRLRLETRS